MTDRFAIGVMLGATAVTNYTVPVQLASRAAILPSALTGALFPRLSASDTEGQRQLFDRSMLTFAAILGLPFIGAIYLIGPFIQVLVGRDLGVEAQMIGRIMVAAAWANGLALISFTKLEASGRPDLVAKMLLLEIPPYLVLLYLGTHYFGVIGAALATAIRYLMDFILLTWAAGAPKHGRPTIAANIVLLSIAVYLAGLWPITDFRWWLSAVVLGAAMTGLSLKTLPKDVRLQGIQTVRGFLRV
jgi:O-antigen/teichoic acid export membrane protein